MSVGLQNLMFKVSLLDKLSGPHKNMMKTMDKVNSRIQSGYQKIGIGLAGVIGVGYGINKLIEPSKQMAAALGEVESLGVSGVGLTKLSNMAIKTSIQYGESASDIVRASYDIQSSIGGLTTDELPAFTRSAAILAKGTKADISTVTDYMGTMFNIFENDAKSMGKAKWVEQLAGQTAMAVQIFKTDGQKIAAGFSQLGNSAELYGVSQTEQIAVMGVLSATMKDGGRTGTSYAAFLRGVAGAQDKLGLSFVNSAGDMLPVTDILDKIKTKYGHLGSVELGKIIEKSFGGSEAGKTVGILLSKVDLLGNSMAKIGSAKGLSKAMQMANAITDPWDRAGAVVTAVQIKFGDKMLKVLEPVFDWITKIGTGMVVWMEKYPNLTRLISGLTLGLFGLIAAFSLINIIVGVSSFVWAGAAIAIKGYAAVMGLLKLSVLTAIPAIWSFTVALLANPFVWMALSIPILIGLVAAVIIYWDEWTGAIINLVSWWWELIGVFAVIDGVIALWDKLPQWWAGFKDFLSDLDLFGFIGDSIDWLLSKINLIPGIDIDVASAPKPPASLTGAGAGDAPSGGLMGDISNVMSSNRSTDVGGVTVNNYGQPMNGFQLADEMSMAAG